MIKHLIIEVFSETVPVINPDNLIQGELL